jgi:hypothetical protein
MADKKVNIQLTKEEAIVLFEFLCRFNEKDDPSRFEDQSEQRVLWDIECTLEKILSEPFRADYQAIIKKYRNAVRDEKE